MTKARTIKTKYLHVTLLLCLSYLDKVVIIIVFLLFLEITGKYFSLTVI